MNDRVGIPARSLRLRVTATVVAVVAVTLLVVGVVVDVRLRAALDRDQQSRLADRAARVDLLVAGGTDPARLVGLLDGQGVRAARVAADGAVLQGAAGAPPPPPAGSGAGAGATGAAPAPPSGPAAPAAPVPTAPGTPPGPLVVTRSLPDGTRLVLTADPGEVDAVVSRLRGVMLAVGLLGLLVSAVALSTGVSASLRPLDAMTRVARAITAGDRGRRLRPSRTDTEIGRAAAAFDEMLDAVDDARGRSEDAARHALAAADQARSAEREARRSEETTRRFLSDAAHELRTPLAGMQALAETLVRESDTDRAEREELAITLVRETTRAAALVGDMLDLARIEGGQPLDRREVDVLDLAADQVDRARLLGPGLAVTLDPPRGSRRVPAEVDPGRVQQILVNLLDNARRHTPADGAVAVRVETDDPDGADRGEVRVVVTNDGEPVAAADAERIFDRLVRLDGARTRDAGGAGLGLAIARAIARAHDGDLTYAPTPRGSAFTLHLPVRAAGRSAPTDSTGLAGDATR